MVLYLVTLKVPRQIRVILSKRSYGSVGSIILMVQYCVLAFREHKRIFSCKTEKILLVAYKYLRNVISRHCSRAKMMTRDMHK